MSNEPGGPAGQSGAPDGAVIADTAPQVALNAVGTGAPSAPRSGGRRYRKSQSRGRRYRAGPPAANQARPAEELPGVVTSPFPSLASPPKALARMLAICLVSCLLATWLHIDLIAGLGFCAGCIFATRFSTPQAQLPVVLSIPVIFLAAELVVQVVTSGGGIGHRTVLSVFAGTALTLAAVAPWLFVGTAGAVVVALFRGLPQSVRDLRAEAKGQRRPTARRG